MNLETILAAIMAQLQKPENQVIIEAVGHGIVTFAQHNQQHLGATVAADAVKVGTGIQQAGALASSL